MSTQWRLTYPDRPWTVNAERGMNKYRRAERTKVWRDAFAKLARHAGVPHLDAARITVEVVLKGPLQDAGAAYPAVKAAVDGVVDAGVLADDNGDYLHRLTFLPPTRGPKCSLTLIIEGDATWAPNWPSGHAAAHECAAPPPTP